MPASRRAAPVLCLAALAAALACGEPDAEPSPLVAIAGPKAFASFELRDGDGAVLWRLEAAAPTRVEELTYGRIPGGFRQVSPAGGSPRQLRPGEALTLVSTTPRRVFVHQGVAELDSRLAVDRWEMRLVTPPAADPGADGEAGGSVR